MNLSELDIVWNYAYPTDELLTVVGERVLNLCNSSVTTVVLVIVFTV